MNQDKALYRWVKASVEPSQHYVNMCCRLIGEDFWFTAYLDWSKKMYVPRNFSGSDGYIDPKEIEYQVKVEADQQELWNAVIKEVELNEFLSTKYKQVVDTLSSKYTLIPKQ